MGWDSALSRRKIFKGSVAVALAGVGTGVLARPASAVTQATTAPSGAVTPAVVNLTDATTIAVDASLGNDFRLTIAGNRTMGSPANPSNGQQIIFHITQGAGGPFTLSWASGYEFSAGMPQPTLSTSAGQTDVLGFICNMTKGTWLFAAYVNGFD